MSENNLNFIEEIIEKDLAGGANGGRVHTRFPPEPNGYLHVGHAKAICINFGMARKYDGLCNLRFDDTNPVKEDVEYVESIIEDIKWLGFDWEDRLFYTSDYFDRLYEYAVALIEKGKAYVDSLSAEEIRKYRGTLTEPGKDSPFRGRSVEENLELLKGMKNGEFDDGEHVLRAKIDMKADNTAMRDPTIYRIRHAEHHRTGSKWCIYPMYDFAHCLSDAIEGITHSLCSIEFENNRPLYEWFVSEVGSEHVPKQREFARLNLTYTILSKRKLLKLVEEGLVSGWDDPRMPTLSGMRRRGYTPESIRTFCDRIGVGKRDSTVDVALLEHCLREDLNKRAPRYMGVLRPLKVIITNYPEDETDELDAVNNPEDESAGTRKVPFSRELYIEQTDFMEDPPRKFFRLAPGREVRLRYGYYITCQEAVKNGNGEITEIHCTYDPETRGGSSPDGRKVKGTIHWVSARHAVQAEVRFYDRLFSVENPDGDDLAVHMNPDSLETLDSCYVEPSLADLRPGDFCQFERHGYFCPDTDSTSKRLVFNRTVSLRDSWAKIVKKGG